MGQKQADLAQAGKTKTYKQSGQHNLSLQNYPLIFFEIMPSTCPERTHNPYAKSPCKCRLLPL